MQTFLPYPDFSQSASVLDCQRLGKQRVETMQIMKVLEQVSEKRGWARHPAVLMWAQCKCALMEYQRAMVTEWTDVRGYKDTCLEKTRAIHQSAPHECEVVLPRWVGSADFHAAHRSNLLRKDWGFYSQFGWDDDPLKPYLWTADAADGGDRFIVGTAVDQSNVHGG